MKDNLFLFLWYCESKLVDDAESILSYIMHEQGEELLDIFVNVVTIITYKAIKYKMRPSMYLFLYRLSYDEIMVSIKD